MKHAKPKTHDDLTGIKYPRQKIYYDNNKLKVLTKHKVYRKEWRKKVLDHLGGACVHCGFDDIRALQIDHVNGGGRKDRNKQVIGFYKKVMENRENSYQLLCANCNTIKRIEKREFGNGKDKIL
jgi:Zn ribbon nucleic-acid-binding protein